MNVKLRLKSKQELLEITKIKYQNAALEEKSKNLDAFLININYRRKYAIYLLNKPSIINKCQTKKKRLAWYDNYVKEDLIIIWHAANKICSKRLVRFLSYFINKLKNHGQYVTVLGSPVIITLKVFFHHICHIVCSYDIYGRLQVFYFDVLKYPHLKFI